jgi:aminoglycoside phosphotransferase (APT) family kinase protein
MENGSEADEANEIELSAWRLERIRMMTSPAWVITDAVTEACGSPPQTVSRVIEGFSNEVYAVRTIAGQEVMVRIHWWSSPYFEEECWALEQCRLLGLSTPQILLLRHHRSGETPRSICVETRLPGQTLSRLLASGRLSVTASSPLIIAAGALLAQVHTISTSGWGRITAEGKGQTAQWSDQVNSIMPDAAQAASRLGLAQRDVMEASRLLQAYASLIAQVPPRLLHGDFSPQQIVVSEGHVSGLIDFEFPRSGDPAWEFAYWDFYTGNQPFRGTRVPTQWLLEGYRQTGSLDATIDLRIAVWRLALSLELLAYHGIRDDQEPDFLTFLSRRFRYHLGELRAFKEV